MALAADIISDINTFLVENSIDREVVEFLMNLKMKVLELDEQRINSGKKKTELSQTEVLLRSLGKKDFVYCYEVFKKAAKGNIGNVSEAIVDCSGARKDTSRRTKASVGVKLFRLGLEIEALKSIVEAEKIEQDVKDEALRMLKLEGC